MSEQTMENQLCALASKLISDVTMSTPSIREGVVMTVGPAPYRRLDCDGRALAYIRTRPRKRVVRVDVSGLWVAPKVSRLLVPNAGGSATLVLRSEQDRREAAEYLRDIVEETRAAHRRAMERRALRG